MIRSIRDRSLFNVEQISKQLRTACGAFCSALQQESSGGSEGLGEHLLLPFAVHLDQLTEVGDRLVDGLDARLDQLSLDFSVGHCLDDHIPTVGVVLGGVLQNLTGEEGWVGGLHLRIALSQALEGVEDEAIVGLDVREVFGELGEDLLGLEAGGVATAEDDLDGCGG